MAWHSSGDTKPFRTAQPCASRSVIACVQSRALTRAAMPEGDAGGIWFFMFTFMGGSFASFAATGHPISDRPGVSWFYSADRHRRSHLSITVPRSRGAFRPGLADRFAEREEGAGNAGCALHPRSHVQNCAKKRTRAYRYSRRHSGIPRAMALRLMPRSPRRRIRLVTVIG